MLCILNRNLSSFYCGMKIWRIGYNLLLLHQESTTLVNEYDVKCLKKNVFCATLKYDCPSPGQLLSSIYTPVRIVSVFLYYFLVHFRNE